MASPHPPTPPVSHFGAPIPFRLDAPHFYQPTAAGFGFGGRPLLEHSQSSPFAAWSGSGQETQTQTQSPGAGPSNYAAQAPTTPGSSFSPTPQRHHSQPSGLSLGGPASASRKRRPDEHEHAGRARDRVDEEDRAEEGGGGRVIAGRRGAAKRIRGEQQTEGAQQADVRDAAAKDTDGPADVDVGVLLASIPPSSHLPILTALLARRPDLAPLVLSLIPPLDVGTCNEELSGKARAVVQAVPLGAGASAARAVGGGIFGAKRPVAGAFGGGSQGYVESRIREPMAAFCASASTFLACFSSTATNAPHPSTTAVFLSHLTSLLLTSLLPLVSSTTTSTTGSPLTSLLRSTFTAWRAWKTRVAHAVNVEGGMFGASDVEAWFRVFDEAGRAELGAGGAGETFVQDLLRVGDELVGEIGWLVGRSEPIKRAARSGQQVPVQQQQPGLNRLHSFAGFGAPPLVAAQQVPQGRISPVDQSMD